jgi:DNA-binding transcriptional LysR family regulator
LKISDLDLNLLVVFNAIYEARSISAAARELDLSQPGISHALKRLRTQLGDELFVRHGNGVAPTAHAETLSTPIRNAIALLETSLAPNDSFDPKTSTRHFRIMMADMAEPLLLPGFIAATQTNKNITFELVSARQSRLENAILQGQVELAVHMQVDMMHEIEAEPLFPIEAVLTHRRGHPLSDNDNPWPHLTDYRFLSINLKSDAVENLDKVKVTQSVDREYYGLVHNIRSLPALLQHSDCISFMPRLFAQHSAERFGLEFRAPPMSLTTQDITLSWHRKYNTDPSITWLRQLFHDIIAEKSRAA